MQFILREIRRFIGVKDRAELSELSQTDLSQAGLIRESSAE